MIEPGTAVNMRHRDGKIEAGTVVAVNGSARKPRSYAIQFACGCTLKGVAPGCVEVAV